MDSRQLVTRALAVALTIGGSGPILTAGQAQTPAAPTYVPPRTPWGDPDLQGTFEYQTRLQLERPKEFEGKATLTEEELKKIRIRTTGSEDNNDTSRPVTSTGWNPLRFLAQDNRTALIIDPPDGRIPLSEEGKQKYAALEEYRRINQEAEDTWAEEGPYSRCIARSIPRLQQGYDGGVQIIQSPGWVAIVYEQLDTQIIPLDGRAPLDPKVRNWQGESRGHWDGNTLVVEMANFNDKNTGWPPFRDQGAWRKYAAGIPDQLDKTGVPRGNLKITMRFVPVGPDRVNFMVTNEDPTWYTQPWTLMLPWTKSPGYQSFEYACNEGNIHIENILRTRRIDQINGHPYEAPPIR